MAAAAVLRPCEQGQTNDQGQDPHGKAAVTPWRQAADCCLVMLQVHQSWQQLRRNANGPIDQDVLCFLQVDTSLSAQ